MSIAKRTCVSFCTFWPPLGTPLEAGTIAGKCYMDGMVGIQYSLAIKTVAYDVKSVEIRLEQLEVIELLRFFINQRV